MKPLLFLFLALSLGCHAAPPGEGTCFNTTAPSRSQLKGIAEALPPQGISIVPPPRIRPVSGTVSHHLLAATVINRWFKALRGLRDIRTFIIISPNHGRKGSQCISLSRDDWSTAGRRTGSNKALIRKFMDDLDAPEDKTAFENEHGIGALLPFISLYFPDTDIVPILIDEKFISMRRAHALADSIADSMRKDAGIFLILSADFSHRCSRTATDENDRWSRRSLITLNAEVKKISDSNAGLDILYRTCRDLGAARTHILCHTDSEKFVSAPLSDITSYFFTYQY